MTTDLTSGDTAALALHVDAFGRMVMTLPGAAPVVNVVPVRCFPFTSPAERVSLCDPQGRELACIADLADLRPDVRSLLEQELSRREFVPIIRRILGISQGSEPTAWHVETDRGEVRFVLTSEDHVRRLGLNGVLISDAEGVRYRVLDTRDLDPKGKKLLKRYL